MATDPTEEHILTQLRKQYPGLRPDDLTFLADLRREFVPFADSEFDTELVSALQPRFFEMYLARALRLAGHTLVPRASLPAAGPDLCIEHSGRRLWIEAIAPDVGSGADAVPDHRPSEPGKVEVHRVPDPEITLRYTGAFATKHDVFARYVRDGIVASDDGLIIAISGGRLPNVRTEAILPRIVHAMYALGPYAVTLDRTTLEVVDEGHTFRDCLPKRSGTEIPTDSLLSDATSRISAVLFSYADPCNRPDPPGLDLILCHHASPRVPLARGWMDRGREYWVEGDLLHNADHNGAFRQRTPS